jgi:hypothetical protein
LERAFAHRVGAFRTPHALEMRAHMAPSRNVEPALCDAEALLKSVT